MKDQRGEMTGPIALVAAMNDELRHALERMEHRTTERVGPWTAHRGALGGKEVVALVCGIGMVNAAAAVSALLTRERPSALINFGCAGAHRDDIHPGDVVVGTGAVAHLSLTILPTGEERYAGFRYQVDDETILSDVIPADSHLLDVARLAARDLASRSMALDSGRPWTGRGSSGRRGLGRLLDARSGAHQRASRSATSLCEDMEAAAIAQVCAMYKVPMLAIKDISNNELHVASSQGVDFPSLEAVSTEVGARAFALVERIIERL